MKKLIILFSLAVIVCISGFSCKKGGLADSLPPATTTGASTMGFLIDGKVWVAKSDDFKISNTSAKYWPSFGLVMNGVSHPDSRISITLANPKSGDYQFGIDDQVRYERYSSPIAFFLDHNNTDNKLNITRYDGNIVSGKFSFRLKSQDGGIVTITSGRFDIAVK